MPPTIVHERAPSRIHVFRDRTLTWDIPGKRFVKSGMPGVSRVRTGKALKKRLLTEPFAPESALPMMNAAAEAEPLSIRTKMPPDPPPLIIGATDHSQLRDFDRSRLKHGPGHSTGSGDMPTDDRSRKGSLIQAVPARQSCRLARRRP
jgi:hypothetical protein